MRGSARTEASSPSSAGGAGVSTRSGGASPSSSAAAAASSSAGGVGGSSSAAAAAGASSSSAGRGRRRVNRPTPSRKLVPTVRTVAQIAPQFHQIEKIPMSTAMVMKVPDTAHTAVLLSMDLPAHVWAPDGWSGFTVMTTRSWHWPSAQAHPSPEAPPLITLSHSFLLSWLTQRLGALGPPASFLDRRWHLLPSQEQPMLEVHVSSASAAQAGVQRLNSGIHSQLLMAEQSASVRPPAEHRSMVGEKSDMRVLFCAASI